MARRFCFVLSILFLFMSLCSSLALNDMPQITDEIFIVQTDSGSLKLDNSKSQSKIKAIKDPSENEAIYIPVDMSGKKIKINGNDRLLRYDNNTFTPVTKVVIGVKSTKSYRDASFSSIDIDSFIIEDVEKKLQKSLENGYENATVTVYAPAIGTYSVTTNFIGYGNLKYKSVITDYSTNGFGPYRDLVKGINIDKSGMVEHLIVTGISIKYGAAVAIAQLFTFFQTNPGYVPVTGDFVQAALEENKSTKYTFMYNYEYNNGTYDLGCIQDKSNIANGKKTRFKYYGKLNGSNFYSTYYDQYFCPSTYDDWSASKLTYDYLHRTPYTPYRDEIEEYQAKHEGYMARFYSIN